MQQIVPSFDHLVGEQQHGLRDAQPKCLRGLDVDHELELGRLLNRQRSSTRSAARRRSRAQFSITRGGQKLAGLVIVISIVHGLGLEDRTRPKLCPCGD